MYRNISFNLLSYILKNNNNLFSKITRINVRTVKTAQETPPAAESPLCDEPIRFTTSKAGQWQAKYSARGQLYYRYPRSQSTIIVFSLTAFMVYFCILREENDLDDWMREIETAVPLKLEEGQLRGQIEAGKRAKEDVSSLEKRLEKVLTIQEKVRASGPSV